VAVAPGHEADFVAEAAQLGFNLKPLGFMADFQGMAVTVV
jgi:hypothetical protein